MSRSSEKRGRPSRVLSATLGLLPLLLLALVAAPEVDLLAWVANGPSWPAGNTSYLVNANFVDAPAGSPAQQIAAIREAADEWRISGQANFAFNYAGETSVSTVAADGTNAVFYGGADGNGALAVCWYWFNGLNAITNFDIEFYDRNGVVWDYIWAISPNFSQFDIQSVATHEFGHALGLGHSSVSGATMQPAVSAGNTANRTLHADDIAGVQSIYGVAGPLAPSVTSVTPSSGWIDGGTQVTILGTGFSLTGTVLVSFGGVSAAGVTVSDHQVLTCTVPTGSVPGATDVSVIVDGVPGTLADGYDYLSCRVVTTPAFHQWVEMQVRCPTDAGLWYQGGIAMGTVGIPVWSFGAPSDTRVIPLSYDEILFLSVMHGNSYPGLFQGMNGFLDGSGNASFFMKVPDYPNIHGFTFYATYATGDPAALSQVGHIGNAVSITYPP